MSEKIYLGIVKGSTSFENSFANKEKLWLEKHEWSCGCFWQFGWIGNHNLHAHFEQFCAKPFAFTVAWAETPFTEEELWVILDCYTQAYALKKAAEVYRYGGHCTGGAYRFKDTEANEKAKILNADLKTVLDWVWEFMQKAGWKDGKK